MNDFPPLAYNFGPFPHKKSVFIHDLPALTYDFPWSASAIRVIMGSALPAREGKADGTSQTQSKEKEGGPPGFSRRDIPAAFYTYYDFYRYGHFNKREFAEFLLVSRPTLDRYLESIHAKPPLLTKAENNELRKQCGIGNSFGERFGFVYQLKELHAEDETLFMGAEKSVLREAIKRRTAQKSQFQQERPGQEE